MTTIQTLEERRARLRLSYIELGGKAGVHKDTVWRVFRGKVDPRSSTLQKLDVALSREEISLGASLSGGASS